MSDVSKQKHYTAHGIQPVEYTVKNNLNFLEGNVIKYVTRHRLKNGLEDLEKAKVYLNWLIEVEKGNTDFLHEDPSDEARLTHSEKGTPNLYDKLVDNRGLTVDIQGHDFTIGGLIILMNEAIDEAVENA